MKRRRSVLGRPWVITVAVSVSVGVAALASPAGAGAPPELRFETVDAGDLVIVSPTNDQRPLTAGASLTPFTFRLPADAVCPGDSANDDWRVQGFMTPVAVDPSNIVFTNSDPDGPGQWALYTTDTRPYVDQLLLMNDRPGQPGLLDAIPPVSFGVFRPGLIEPGDYRLGIGCTYVPRRLERYWDVVVTIIDDPNDEPAGFRWLVQSDPSSGAVADTSPARRWMPVVGVTAGAALIAFAVFSFQASRQRRLVPSVPKETP